MSRWKLATNKKAAPDPGAAFFIPLLDSSALREEAVETILDGWAVSLGNLSGGSKHNSIQTFLAN